MNLISSATSDRNGDTRIDVNAEKGESFFIKAVGESESVDFSFDNLVSLEDGRLIIHGTNRNDSISVSAGDNFSVNVNGLDYEFDHSAVNLVHVFGHKGNDSVSVELGAENDTASIHAEGLSVVNQNFKINAYEFQSNSIVAGGGYDVVSLIDSAGHDVLTGQDSENGYSATLTRSGSQSTVAGFDLTYVASTGGNDSAQIVGTKNDDIYISRGEKNFLRVDGTNFVFNNFADVNVDGGGGEDIANLNDTSGNDQFVLSPRSGSIASDIVSVQVDDFARINAFSVSGSDSVSLRDSAGDDVFDYRNDRGLLTGENYTLLARGFASVEAVSTGGNDTANIYDTAGNDQLFSDAGDATLVSSNSTVSATDFKAVNIIANRGGFDRATVVGTDGADVAHANLNSVQLDNSKRPVN